MKKYNKLVRDRIPEIIRKNGDTPTIHIAMGDEYRAKLYDKFVEESSEVTKSPSLEEGADVMEVFQLSVS